MITDGSKQNKIPVWVKNNFEAFENALNGHKEKPIHKIRKQAMQFLSEKGLPLPSDEEWKYTNISEIFSKNFKIITKPVQIELKEISRFLISGTESPRLVFVDGVFSGGLSNIETEKEHLGGLKISLLNKVLDSQSELKDHYSTINLTTEKFGGEQAIVALNTLFAAQGIVLNAAKNAAIAGFLQILFVSTGSEKGVFAAPRIMVNAEEGSSLSIIESHVSLKEVESLTSPLSEIRIGKNAEVNYYKLGLENNDAYHLGNILLSQENDSRSNILLFTTGGKLVRNEVRMELNGTNCHAAISGLTVLDGEQHVDNHTVINHALPHSESREKIKGIYSGKSRGVFNGTIIVQKDAQKTNAYQSNQSVLLSTDANVDTKPQLKIWADDVKCTHGATVGQLDDNALFYLRSRGLDKQTARNLLVRAFASEIFTDLKEENLRTYLEGKLSEKLDSLSI